MVARASTRHTVDAVVAMLTDEPTLAVPLAPRTDWRSRMSPYPAI
jgi:hypothetical protein